MHTPTSAANPTPSAWRFSGQLELHHMGVIRVAGVDAATFLDPTSKDNTFILTAALTPNVTYQWYQNNVPISGATSNLFSISTPGTYFVRFTNNVGCVKNSDTLIVGYFPVTPPVFQYIAPVLSVGNYLTYQWYFNSQPIIGANTNSIAINQNGVYYVHVKDFNECEYDSSPFILDNLNIASIYQSNIIAYPNPTNGYFEIALPISEKEITIELYTMQSQLISKRIYPVIAGKIQISIVNKPAGLYLAKVYVDKPITLKIIKQ